MDELRGELLAKGTLDSSGRFTVALDRVAQILGAHALPSVEHCILRLLAAAVAGGASYFEYEALSTGYRVRYDGLPVEVDGLLEMRQPHLTELAVAVYTAGNRGARVRVNDCLVVEKGRWRAAPDSRGEPG